jgi:ATP-dependent Clp protease ATP-binding subunit ClpA
VLETAATQALKLGHNYVGTEHLLLGLAQDPILADRAVGFDQVHEAVLAVVDAYLRRR